MAHDRFEDTLDQTASNLEYDNVCWVRYRFLVVEEALGKKCEDFESDAQEALELLIEVSGRTRNQVALNADSTELSLEIECNIVPRGQGWRYALKTELACVDCDFYLCMKVKAFMESYCQKDRAMGEALPFKEALTAKLDFFRTSFRRVHKIIEKRPLRRVSVGRANRQPTVSCACKEGCSSGHREGKLNDIAKLKYDNTSDINTNDARHTSHSGARAIHLVYIKGMKAR
uniref:Uncharacterized protein n=1 Tax=Tanacetum cinerariifolium TaxID=118510 RepID=A0A6L2NVD0_TANCI|nr:hypothetical protein [Tanacetum cinerariifolium]